MHIIHETESLQGVLPEEKTEAKTKRVCPRCWWGVFLMNMIALALMVVVFFVKEARPPNLHTKTVYSDLPSLDLLRSFSNLGAVERFIPLADKISHNRNINALILGGSITCSHPQGIKRWFQFLPELAKVIFSFDNRCASGTGTDWAIHRLGTWLQDKKYDIVFVEYGNNDAMVRERADIRNKINSGLSTSESISHYAEILVQIVLGNNPEAIVWFVEMGFRYRKPLGFFHAENAHKDVALYYEMPVTSSTWPVYRQVAHFDRSLKEFQGDCCHPREKVHNLTAYFLAEHLKMMSNLAEYAPNHNFNSVVKNPWFISKQELSKYVLPVKEDFRFDVANPRFDVISKNDTFVHIHETIKKKYGLVAYGELQRIQFRLQSATEIVMSYLCTYENIGGAFIWISKDSKFGNGCDGGENTVFVNAYRGDSSQQCSKIIQTNFNGDCYLNVCTARTIHGQKFKITGVLTKE